MCNEPTGSPSRDIAIVQRHLAAKVEQDELGLEDPRFAAGYLLNAVKGTPSGISLSPYAGLSPQSGGPTSTGSSSSSSTAPALNLPSKEQQHL
jgi:hypothetical protein